VLEGLENQIVQLILLHGGSWGNRSELIGLIRLGRDTGERTLGRAIRFCTSRAFRRSPHDESVVGPGARIYLGLRPDRHTSPAEICLSGNRANLRTTDAQTRTARAGSQAPIPWRAVGKRCDTDLANHQGGPIGRDFGPLLHADGTASDGGNTVNGIIHVLLPSRTQKHTSTFMRSGQAGDTVWPVTKCGTRSVDANSHPMTGKLVHIPWAPVFGRLPVVCMNNAPFTGVLGRWRKSRRRDR
jgi:hypothetical protein